MTRRDYKVLAAAFHTLLTGNTGVQLLGKHTAKAVFDEMVAIVADSLYYDNERFDRDTFFTAVYQGEEY